MEAIEFRKSVPFTLGVEVEFQLLDRVSLDLSQRAPEILDSLPEILQNRIKPEFIRSMIEINTEICRSVGEVEENLLVLCRELEQRAHEHGCLLLSTSLHPFARYDDQIPSPLERYARIMDELQLVGRRFITQGLHVHVGIDNGETAIRVCDAIRIYLPLLLAMTTSSPYYQGEDTGLHSYRAKLFEALPLAGIPDYFATWTNFRRTALLLIRCGIIHQVRDLWWDVRPHPDFGTVEIRICDLPSRFDEIIAVTALVQALVVYLSRVKGPIPDANSQILRSNKWQAARHGLAGRFVDPFALENRSQAEAAAALIQTLEPTFSELGTGEQVAALHRIISQGTSTDRQRALHKEGMDFSALINEIRREFWL